MVWDTLPFAIKKLQLLKLFWYRLDQRHFLNHTLLSFCVLMFSKLFKHKPLNSFLEQNVSYPYHIRWYFIGLCNSVFPCIFDTKYDWLTLNGCKELSMRSDDVIKALILQTKCRWSTYSDNWITVNSPLCRNELDNCFVYAF